MIATNNDTAKLEALYEGRKVYHGELHDHSASGGTSDGRRPFSHWLGAMEALELDFATILDHRQVRHMFEPEWEDGTFIGALEVFYISTDSEETKENYELYVKLLSLGKKVYCSAGGDEHECCHDKAITTIYAAEKKNAAYIDRLRHGDFVCGGVGIRMCIGDTVITKYQFGVK